MTVLRLALLDARRRLGRTGLAVCGFALGATLALRAVEAELRRGWIFPTDDAWRELRTFWLPASFVLGLVVLGAERLAGAREVLLHRGVSRSRLAAARIVAGLGALGALLAAGFLLPGPARALVDPDGALLSVRLLGERALLATVCLAAFGAGAYAATARVGLLGRALLAVLVFVVVALEARTLVEAPLDAFAGSWSAYVGAQLGLAALFLQGAHAGYLRPADLDRPLERRHLARQGVPAAVAMALLAVLFVPLVQDALQRSVVADWPDVVRTRDDRLELRGRDSELGDERVLEPSGELNRRRRGLLQRLQPQRVHFGRPPHLGSRWEALAHEYPWIRSFVERPSGRVHTWYLAANEAAEGFTGHVVLGRGASGEPFSPDVEILGGPGPFGVDQEPAVLGDPVHGTLWSYAFTDPQAVPERFPLPDGDRYVGWTSRRGRPFEAPGGTFVEGEHGSYLVQYVGTTPVAGADQPPEAPPELVLRHIPRTDLLDVPRVDARFLDPLALDVAVTTAAGERLERRYRPRGASQRWRAGLAQAFLLWRPPLGVAAGHLGAGPEREVFRRALLVDPLARDGRRGWLVGLHLALCALVAWRCATRLRRAGAEPWRARAWAAAVLLGGPAVGYVLLVLEPRSAWRALPATEAAPDVCIRSLETSGGVS